MALGDREVRSLGLTLLGKPLDGSSSPRAFPSEEPPLPMPKWRRKNQVGSFGEGADQIIGGKSRVLINESQKCELKRGVNSREGGRVFSNNSF